MKTKAVCVLTFLFFLCCSGCVATKEVMTFNAENIKSLRVINGPGNVYVTSLLKGEDKAEVVVEKVKFNEKCKYKMNIDNTELVVELVEPSAFITTVKCLVNFTIKVPYKINSDISTGSGNIKINSMSGRLNFKVGSGNVSVKDSQIIGLQGTSGSGNINVSVLNGDGSVTTGSGNIELKHSKSMMQESKINIETESGTVQVYPSSDSIIKSHYQTKSGVFSNDFIESNEKPDLFVDVKTKSGNLKIVRRTN